MEIRIGIRNRALDQLLEWYQVREWAFVTASNPGSCALSESENACRNAGLAQALKEAGLPYLEAIGVPDTTGWEPEQSCLVLGITKSNAMAMAKHWGQRAIVWGVSGNPPELVWIDREGVASS